MLKNNFMKLPSGSFMVATFETFHIGGYQS